MFSPQHVERIGNTRVTHVSDLLPTIVVANPQSLDRNFPATMLMLQHVRKSTAAHHNTR